MADRVGDPRKKVQVRLTDDEYQQLTYWAAKDEVSINEWITEAIQRSIKFKNGDYDLLTLEQQRLNQLIDVVTTLSSNVQGLESVITSGFDSLLGLTRGDNYLLEEEDGEI